MTKAAALKVTTPSDREITITRVFDAPRELVFEGLTKPELFKRWCFGPDGWTFAVCDMATKVGDPYRYVWRKGKIEMGMGGVMLEFIPPERIVVTEKFDDAWYPGEAVITTVLTEHDGKTTLAMTILYESRAARDVALQSPMDQGLGAGFDRLAEILASRT